MYCTLKICYTGSCFFMVNQLNHDFSLEVVRTFVAMDCVGLETEETEKPQRRQRNHRGKNTRTEKTKENIEP